MSKKSLPMLSELEANNEFTARHIGPSPEEVAAMLKVVNASSLDDLTEQTIPSNILYKGEFDLDGPTTERDTLSYVRKIKDRNQVFVSMIGMGYYGTILPAVIRRNVLENPSWYTAYTPYQAEVSQGRLEVLLTFQQMVADITQMDLSNASLLDEATAAAEAMSMSYRLSKSKVNKILVSSTAHPQNIAVLQTRARHMGIEVVVKDIDFNDTSNIDTSEYFAILLQYPDTYGNIDDMSAFAAQAKADKCFVIVATDLMALTQLTAPGTWGADIVVGSTQRFGVPMSYGGPHAAFLATRDEYKRALPGRIIGVSVDSRGKTALRMALQTREQHIRRDKATSNICTAQVLLAILSALYACYHGPKGIDNIAKRIHKQTVIAVTGLRQLGFKIVNDTFYDTFVINVPGQARRIAAKARESKINLRIIDSDNLGVSLDETTRSINVKTLWTVFQTRALEKLDFNAIEKEAMSHLPDALMRQEAYLEHPVFNSHHSETKMMRYLQRLSSKDIALDRSMIPLGSCTMKLNATTEMLPITFRNFTAMHPYAPLEQAQGYQQLVEELENQLCTITGFDRISFQPNSGAQGEYTGLLCIRKFHDSNGDQARDICLIPDSAHGTNPASAVMAGFSIVPVKSDSKGNVDIADLETKALLHKDKLGAFMITYPSTHGVFEQEIVKILEIIHENGGQVYLDGANLNAMVAVCRPADFGADVMHMNLHKTFCIPHGGGGPGVGPIGVKSHLAKHLPDHPVVLGVNEDARDGSSVGPVAAAPWGSAGILPIPWAYIKMMGAEGLRLATQNAILSANYIATRLKPHFPILYTGKNERVAHECIIDLRDLKERCSISVEDVVKRLVDYGFHAPTMSFPVADTLMIEPTESESQEEIDRFCDAMISIHGEILEVENGTMDKTNNVLKNSPHTYDLLVAETWDRPYSREKAFFPLPWIYENKFWPPVSRVDNIAGDKKLVATCPPLSAYL